MRKLQRERERGGRLKTTKTGRPENSQQPATPDTIVTDGTIEEEQPGDTQAAESETVIYSPEVTSKVEEYCEITGLPKESVSVEVREGEVFISAKGLL